MNAATQASDIASLRRRGVDVYAPLAYSLAMLPDPDIAIDFDADLSDHPIIVVVVTTRAGRIEIMAEVSGRGRALTLRRTHVQSAIGSNTIDWRRCGSLRASRWKGWAMTKSSLRERLGRLGPIRDVPRSRSGSACVFALKHHKGQRVETITAARLLAEAGLSLFKAKRTVERAIEVGEVYVRLTHVQKPEELSQRIDATGLEARALLRLRKDQVAAQIKKVRAQLNLSQEQFALRYGFDVDALQNWEQGRREPPGAWLFAYLCAIADDPEGTSKALEVIPLEA